jgi:3-hydroxyacyl-[acyl-carrier-protein] dehydratase
MFLDSLYTLQKQDLSVGYAAFSVSFQATHSLYAGHFPGSPVTPGVVLGEIVKELLEFTMGCNVKMQSMRQCKFLLAHNPELFPLMDIELKWAGEGEWVVQAVGKSSDSVFFKLSANYLPA